MKKKLNKKGIIVISIIVFFVLLFLITIVVYFSKLRAVSRDDSVVELRVEDGDAYSTIVSKLDDLSLIRSLLAYKIYVKTHHLNTLDAGVYELRKNMSVGEILDVLSSGNYKEDSITITFKEGINMRGIASLIADNTNNTEEDVYNLLKDKDFLNSLIDKYWFITDDILNEDIYFLILISLCLMRVLKIFF